MAARVPAVVAILMRIPSAALTLAGLGLVACTTSPRSSVAETDSFPREAWQRAANIEDLGWSPAGMTAFEKRVGGIGSAAFMVVTRGRIVAAWGDTARTFWSHSLRKSLLSALIGQAVSEGKIDTDRTLAELGIDEKGSLLALNKIDQPEVQERLGEIEKKFKELNVEVMTISALARTNTRELLLRAYQMLQEAPPLEEVELPLPVYKPKEDPREFNITREGASEWRISGVAIERAASMTYWQHDGLVRRFQKIMETLGVDEALRKAGVQEGDVIVAYDDRPIASIDDLHRLLTDQKVGVESKLTVIRLNEKLTLSITPVDSRVREQRERGQ